VSISALAQGDSRSSSTKHGDGNTALEDTVSKVQNNRIMLLNAYNFDFGSTALASNYVGHLNLFAPSIDKKKKWGFNTGILKISYGQKDTSQNSESLVMENTFINPFDTLATGIKYLRQINAYKTEKKNTVWSFYVQPLYELTEPSAKQHIYLHTHLELVSSKWSATTTISNKQQDTAIFAGPHDGFVIRSAISNNSSYTINSLSGYFGAGFTADLRPWDGGAFFFQPTIGETSNRPSPSSEDISANVRYGTTSRSTTAREWNAFYLVRSYYTQVINDAALVIGVDIRGLFPLYAPQYAAYVGLNIGVDSILKLVGGKSEK
jgi:hypothetical protein